MRWLSIAAGLALIALAFAAATHVADTREGLIAEVVTLLGGLAGVSLLLLGMFTGIRPAAPQPAPVRPRPSPASPAVRPVRDLLLGAGGLLLALILAGGLAVSGGWLWAALGCLLLLPMVAGSAYLCVRFARAPARDWKLELRKTSRS
jgi:hypothetical protein